MKWFMKTAALCLLIPNVTNAQECNQIISRGIYDIYSSSIDLQATASFAQWFCDQRFSSEQQAKSFGASLAFPFEGVPVQLGFDSKSQSWGQWYSSFCSSVHQDSSLQNRLRSHIQIINPKILAAFNDCINADGLHVWLERTEDPKILKFAAKFNPPNEKNPFARIRTFETQPSSLKCTNIPKQVSRPVWRTHCVRQDRRAVSVVVTADFNPRGGGTLTLPRIPAAARLPAPPPAPTPEKANTLFVGQTLNCNAAIVTNHQGHLNCVNTPLGYTIKAGPAAMQMLYLGIDPNVNAGVISVKPSFRGGRTQDWGYTIRQQYKLPGSAQIFAVVGCGANDGEVTTNANHKNCPTTPIGWIYPW